MKLNDLKKLGGVVSAAPVQKEITWKKVDESGVEQEYKFTVFVIKHSFGTIEQIYADKEDRSKAAAFIAKSIRLGEKGEEVLTYEDAYQLESSLATQFLGAINEVNGTGKVKN